MGEDVEVGRSRSELNGAGVIAGSALSTQGYLTSNTKPGTVVCGKVSAGANQYHYGVITGHHVVGDWTGTFRHANEAARTLVPDASGTGDDSDGCVPIAGGALHFCRMNAPAGSTARSTVVAASIASGTGVTGPSVIDPIEFGTQAAILPSATLGTISCGKVNSSREIHSMAVPQPQGSPMPFGATCNGINPADVTTRQGSYECFNFGTGAHGTPCCALKCVNGNSWVDSALCGTYLPACRPAAGVCGGVIPSTVWGTAAACDTNAFRTAAQTASGLTGWTPNTTYASTCVAVFGNTPFTGGSGIFNGSTLVGATESPPPAADTNYSTCGHMLTAQDVTDINAAISAWCG